MRTLKHGPLAFYFLQVCARLSFTGVTTAKFERIYPTSFLKSDDLLLTSNNRAASSLCCGNFFLPNLNLL